MKQPKFQRRAEDRPREICAAALEVFAEKGFAAAKLDDIARRAGVSKGTLYLYFTDKEELFRAVVKNTIAPNIDAVRDAIMAADLPFAQLAPMFLARMSEMATRTPLGRVVKMVIGESGNFPELAKVWHDQIAVKAFAIMTGLIERAQQRGEVRPGNPRYHAFSLMGPMLMGLLYREVLQPAGGEPLDLQLLARQHAETALAGLLMEKTS